MNTNPTFNYYIADKNHPVNDRDEVWQSALPGKRQANPLTGEGVLEGITCGDYFTAVHLFLSEENCKSLIHGIRVGYDKTIAKKDMDSIHILLIKHGVFYHPAKIEVLTGSGAAFGFVLNVAVSKNGSDLIAREYNTLSTFHLLFPYPFSFVPRVFDLGGIAVADNRVLTMFLGEWFHGFYEFHWSKNPESDDAGIVVWDDRKGHYFLNPEQTRELYRQAALIMTCYYNFSSCYQVSMWHHAAGDFVVGMDAEGLSVRLITVRQYAPLMEVENPDMWTLLEALFLFFLNLSIRMRLDRMDGVGDTVWAHKASVVGIVEGFFWGLQTQSAHGQVPGDLVDGFMGYVKMFSQKQLLEWSTTVAQRMYQGSPDLDLILSSMDAHAHDLYNGLELFLSSP